MGTEQQFCLKWNNHRSTILSVFDNLLEEESLVDVTLTAEGQFLRAHKVILSACSPYFRIMFRAANEKHPVIYMQNVDFDNLKALVEYMYKGEANVPQHMLPSFIRTAESLQIRGLAEGANHQYESGDPSTTNSLPPPSHASTPQPPKEHKKNDKKSLSPPPNSGILAARLAKMADHPSSPLFNFAPGRGGLTAAHLTPPLGGLNKKRRNTLDKDLSPIKQNKFPCTSKNGSKGSSLLPPPGASPINAAHHMHIPATASSSSSSFIENDEEGDLKIDEDAGDLGKENRASPANHHIKTDQDEDITDLEANGVESEDEEPSMPAPGSTDIAPGGIINPWTGEDMSSVIEEHEDANNPSQRSGSSSDTAGLVGWPGLLGGDFSESAHSPFASHAPLSANPTPPPPPETLSGMTTSVSSPSGANTNKLKRFTNNDSAYTMVQTSKGLKFRCNACSRIFNLKCTLLRHVRHQHQGRFVPHPCPQCGQVFKRTDHLKVHMKKIHNIAPVSKGAKQIGGDGHSPPATALTPANPPMVVDYEEEQPRDLSSSSSRLRDEASPGGGGGAGNNNNHLVPSPLLFNTQAKAH